MPFCTNCGNQNPNTSNFCTTCGTVLIHPAKIVATEQPERPSSQVDSSIEKQLQADNVSNTQYFAGAASHSSDFDISKWLNKNKIGLVCIFGIAVALFVAYNFFLKNDPVKDAKSVAADYCDCTTKYTDAMIKVNEGFSKSFATYGFKKSQQARDKLQVLQKSALAASIACNTATEKKYLALRNRYAAKEEMITKFDNAYKALFGTCNTLDQNKLTLIYAELEKQIIELPPDLETIKKDTLQINNEIAPEIKIVTLTSPTYFLGDVEHLTFKDFTTQEENEYEWNGDIPAIKEIMNKCEDHEGCPALKGQAYSVALKFKLMDIMEYNAETGELKSTGKKEKRWVITAAKKISNP